MQKTYEGQFLFPGLSNKFLLGRLKKKKKQSDNEHDAEYKLVPTETVNHVWKCIFRF